MAQRISDYDGEDLVPHGKLSVEWSVDLTDDVPDPEYDLVARYGRDGGRILVQLFEPRPNQNFATNAVPIELLMRDQLPPAFVEFLSRRHINPRAMANIITHYATPPVS